MRTKLPAIFFGIALLAVAIATFVFFTRNHPDRMPPGATRLFGWMALCPIAFLAATLPRFPVWAGALGIIGGVLIGALFRFVTPPFQSNIWPIAVVYWTSKMAVPILTGSLAGIVARWSIRKLRRR